MSSCRSEHFAVAYHRLRSLGFPRIYEDLSRTPVKPEPALSSATAIDWLLTATCEPVDTDAAPGEFGLLPVSRNLLRGNNLSGRHGRAFRHIDCTPQRALGSGGIQKQ